MILEAREIQQRRLTFFGSRCGSLCLGVDAWPWLAAAVLPLLDPFVHGRDVLAVAVLGELAAFTALHLVAHLLLVLLLFFQFRCRNRMLFSVSGVVLLQCLRSLQASVLVYIAPCSAGSL